MDLNEKLASRRRELNIEAEKAKITEEKADEARAVHQKELAIEAEKAKKAEQDIIDAEVQNRLAELGLTQLAPAVSKSKVDIAVEKALSKAASDRMTKAENTKFIVLLVLGIFFLFGAWPIGVGFIVWAIIYRSKIITRHKEKIIAEGKSNLSKLKETQLSEEQGITSAQSELSDIYANEEMVQKNL